MLGLVVRFDDLPPVRAAIRGDGVVTVIAHVVRKRHGRRLRHESMVAVGGLVPPDRHGRWLVRNLRPRDEVRIQVAPVRRPSPLPERRPPRPRPLVRPASGIEVLLNGKPFERGTVEDRTVVLAVVTWCRGTKGQPGGAESVSLGFGPTQQLELRPGDEVILRALG